MRPCEFPGCDRFVKARGLCGGHYEQRRRGLPKGLLLTERTLRNRGPRNGNWSENITYNGAHQRVRKTRGKPTSCSRADSTCHGRMEWANLTGRYEDPTDYEAMCHSHNERMKWKETT